MGGASTISLTHALGALGVISLVVLGIELVRCRPDPRHSEHVSALTTISEIPTWANPWPMGVSAVAGGGASGRGASLPEVYASYAAKEVDVVRAMVIALNLRALNSTRGYVLFTHNNTEAFKAIVAKYDRPELRKALNFRFGRFPTTLDPALSTPPAVVKSKQWRHAWIKVSPCFEQCFRCRPPSVHPHVPGARVQVPDPRIVHPIHPCNRAAPLSLSLSLLSYPPSPTHTTPHPHTH